MRKTILTGLLAVTLATTAFGAKTKEKEVVFGNVKSQTIKEIQKTEKGSFKMYCSSFFPEYYKGFSTVKEYIIISTKKGAKEYVIDLIIPKGGSPEIVKSRIFDKKEYSVQKVKKVKKAKKAKKAKTPKAKKVVK